MGQNWDDYEWIVICGALAAFFMVRNATGLSPLSSAHSATPKRVTALLPSL
jgi:hypothetical protein